MTQKLRLKPIYFGHTCIAIDVGISWCELCIKGRSHKNESEIANKRILSHWMQPFSRKSLLKLKSKEIFLIDWKHNEDIAFAIAWCERVFNQTTRRIWVDLSPFRRPPPAASSGSYGSEPLRPNTVVAPGGSSHTDSSSFSTRKTNGARKWLKAGKKYCFFLPLTHWF